MVARLSKSRLSAVLVITSVVLAACGDGGAPASEEPEGTGGTGELGPAEQTDITVAIPFPDPVMYSMYIIATEEGYYEEEGLTVEVITADDPNAAVVSGSADIGVQSAGAVIEAIRGGLEIEVLASHFCRQRYSFAVQPEVEAVEDLAGQDVVVAGTAGDPVEHERMRILAEEGWDLSTVDPPVNQVYPGPDSATGREFFLAGRVALVYFYADDIAALEEYGANFPVDELRNWPNDLHIAQTGWADENPNTAARFLRATIRGAQFMVAPEVGEPQENKDRILEIYEQYDFDTEPYLASDSPYALATESFCPNLYYDEDAWNITIETQQLDPLDPAEGINIDALLAAQESLGIGNDQAPEIPWPAPSD
jgi:ABC-type nitrate/sulfonate/bicarbonate transport system substrate-binding protein